jgi:hypothetical protein
MAAMVLDAPSKRLAPEDEVDESDDDVDYDHQPFQLFGTNCENWDDVVVVLKERPNLLEKFLSCYRKLLKYRALTLFSRCRDFRTSRLLYSRRSNCAQQDTNQIEKKRKS